MRFFVLLSALVCYTAASPAVFESAYQAVRSAVSLVSDDRYEEAPYTATEMGDQIQKRVYPGKKWACTKRTVSADDTEENSGMFWKLFRYIQGANDQEMKIKMTVPVSTETVRNGNNMELEMCFFIGEQHQANPPAPTNPDVTIKSAARTIYTRTIGGYMNKASWALEAKVLGEKLTEMGLNYDNSKYFTVGYDAPFKWWNRRNEIWYLAQ